MDRLRSRVGWWSACGWGSGMPGTVRPDPFTLGVVGERGSHHEGRVSVRPRRQSGSGQLAEGGRGVVVSLAPRPALAIWVAMFGRSDLGDDGVWSLLGQDCQEAGPVDQAEAVDQAGGAVAEHGRSVQALAGNGVDQRVLGGGRVGTGDPEPVGMVAVAALFGDELSEAAGMGGGAGGLLMHRVVLHGGDALQPV